MRSLAALLTIVSVVAADVSHLANSGYHYNVPHTSYGVPIQEAPKSTQQEYVQTSQSYEVPQTNNYQNGYQSSSNFQSGGVKDTYVQPEPQYIPAQTPVVHHSAPQVQYTAPVQHSGYESAKKTEYTASQTPTYQYNTAPVVDTSKNVETNYKTSTYNQYQESSYQQVHQPAQIFKHFYVHSAPEEPEQPKFRQPIAVPPPQKHYKVIFINAPVATPAPAPQIPVQPQTEEKTIVYVLVKKPEAAPEVVPTPAEIKPPTKPEVFFIKYNGKDNSQSVINNIVKEYNGKQGGSVSFSGIETASGYHSVGGDNSQIVPSADIQGAHQSGVTTFERNEVTSSGSNDQGNLAGSGYSSDSSSQGSFNSVSSGTGHNVNGYTSGGISSTSGQNFNGYSTGGAVHHANNEVKQGLPHETYGPPNFKSS